MRDRDRRLMHQLVAERGFEHAIGSLADVVAVEVGDGVDRAADARMETVARVVSVAVIDALVTVALRHGWKGAE